MAYVQYDMVDEHPPVNINNRKIFMPENVQMVVARDNVSQIITFKINRYFEGVDFSEKDCAIKYINANKEYGKVNAANVEVEDDKFIFCWILDDNVAAKAGVVKFAIEFSGLNEHNQPYIWQTTAALLKVEEGIWVE